MKRLRRLEVMIAAVVFALSLIANLIRPSTIDFFVAVLSGIALTMVVVRALLDIDWPGGI
jgi:hypothetical protein